MTSDGDDRPTEPRLRRSTTDRFLGGVAGGLARRLGVDPAVVRIGIVAVTCSLAFSTGDPTYLVVLLPYALAWVVIPPDGGRSLLRRLPNREAAQELALVVVLLLVAVLVVAQPGAIVVAALGGLAVVLLRDHPDEDPVPDRDGDAPRVAPDEATLVEPAATSSGRRGLGRAADAVFGRLPPALGSPGRPRQPRRPRRDPALWPLALGLLVALGVGAAAVDGVLGIALDPRLVVDVALLVVGGVLVLTAWRGRARLALLAVPLILPVWLATSVPDIGRFEGTGRRIERPTALPTRVVDDRRTSVARYQLGYGDLTVDLTALDLPTGSRTRVTVDLTAGRARVRVPAGARLELRGTIGLGVVGVEVPAVWSHARDPMANRSLDRSYPPVRPRCREQRVATSELAGILEAAHLPVGSDPVDPSAAGSPEREDPGGRPVASADVIDAVEAAGFPRPAVEGTVTDVPTDDPTFGEDLVRVSLSDQWELCVPAPADPDPPIVTIDATIGLGDLEVTRV